MHRHGAWASALATLATCLGCAAKVTLSQLSPEQQAMYGGTNPGWHELSPYFAVEIKNNSRATFYHYREPGNAKSKEAIGGQYMFWPGDPVTPGVAKFGPRENAYALSEDGRNILYFREPPISTLGDLFQEHTNDFPAELHLFRHGIGDSLIIAKVDHMRGGPRVPNDAVIYAVPDRAKYVSEAIVRRIGEFIPR